MVFLISSMWLLLIIIVVMVVCGVQCGFGVVFNLEFVFFGQFQFYCVGGVDGCIDGVVELVWGGIGVDFDYEYGGGVLFYLVFYFGVL